MVKSNAITLKNVAMEWAEKNEHIINEGLNIKSSKEMLVFEQKLLCLLIQLGALIMARIIKARVEDKEFQKEAARKIISTKPKRYRFVRYVATSITTLFGNAVGVKIRYYRPRRTKGRKCKSGNRGKNGSGIFPVLEVLGIRAGVTPALASCASREVTEGPSMEAAQERLARWGISLDIKMLQRISETFAAISLAIRKAWLETGGRCDTSLISKGESLKGLRVLISIDGGRMRTRKNKRGRKSEGKKRHGYNTPWREPKVITIRAIDDRGKVIREIPPIYDGTLDNADAAFELLEAHLRARDISSATEIVCAGDGSPWIWNRMNSMLEKLGVESSKVSNVVDFYHTVEHLAKVADGKRGWTKRERERWMKKMRPLLKQGCVEDVINELKKLARGRNAKAVKTEIKYFEEHKKRMRYDLLEARGLPLGSGAVESAIRQIVNLRLKGAGMFWHERNAEGFLHLRCYLKAGRWDIMERAVINYQKGGG